MAYSRSPKYKAAAQVRHRNRRIELYALQGNACLYCGESDLAVLDALRHLMFRDHRLDPVRCEGCRDIAAFIAVPGHAGIEHPEVH
jgi:MinD superfamily P-loop ATPase